MFYWVYDIPSWAFCPLAVLIGLTIFLTAAMDNPFRGEFSVGPDAFISVRDQLMNRAQPDIEKGK